MKKQIIITLALAVAVFSCEKNQKSCGLLPAKIIRYDCDRAIIQLDAEKMIGDSSWTDVLTGKIYRNVVSYHNTCRLNTITKGQLTQIYVTVVPIKNTVTPEGCYQCAAVSPNPPQNKVDLTEISTSACNMEQ